MNILGINDDKFIRGNIPMTKQEIRIMALAKARIQPDSIVLDIGAGTGSFSIEAALQAKDGQVFAVERQPEGVELIRLNANKFGINNINVIHGSAPAAMYNLPQADVIFIGGSGGHIREILVRSDELLKLGGRLIMTAITVESLYNVLTIMRGQPDYKVSASGIQITRIKPVGTNNMFEALNQIYIISCIKGGHNDTAW